jgi:hypothetical protein
LLPYSNIISITGVRCHREIIPDSAGRNQHSHLHPPNGELLKLHSKLQFLQYFQLSSHECGQFIVHCPCYLSTVNCIIVIKSIAYLYLSIPHSPPIHSKSQFVLSYPLLSYLHLSPNVSPIRSKRRHLHEEVKHIVKYILGLHWHNRIHFNICCEEEGSTSESELFAC